MFRVVLAAACLAAAAGALSASPAQTPPQGVAASSKELTRAETEARVRADAARRFRLEAAAVVVIESADRVWPDAGLGCLSRRGVLGDDPVPGFRIVVEANGQRLPYHTDRFGRLRVCLTPPKPFDPIR